MLNGYSFNQRDYSAFLTFAVMAREGSQRYTEHYYSSNDKHLFQTDPTTMQVDEADLTFCGFLLLTMLSYHILALWALRQLFSAGNTPTKSDLRRRKTALFNKYLYFRSGLIRRRNFTGLFSDGRNLNPKFGPPTHRTLITQVVA